MFKQVGWRMTTTSPSVVIDEYVAKVDKVTGQIGSQAELERRLTAQIGQDAFWKYQQHLAMLTDDPGGMGGGGMPPVAAPAPMPATMPAPMPPQPPSAIYAGPSATCDMAAINKAQEGEINRRARLQAGDVVRGTGGWMMGISLIAGGVGGLLVSVNGAEAVGAIGLTLGAVLLIGGLIVYIIGANLT
jgi:hypothetical protein